MRRRSRNIITSFVSIDLNTRTTAHLLYRSFQKRLYGSPVTCVVYTLPEMSLCISLSCSLPVVWFVWSTEIGILNSYRSPCKQCLYCTCSRWPSSFRTTNFFCFLQACSLNPGNWSVMRQFFAFFSSSAITILPPANNKPNKLVITLKTGDNFSGGSFFLFTSDAYLQL